MLSLKPRTLVFLFPLYISFLLLFLVNLFYVTPYHHFMDLAKSFTQGHLFFSVPFVSPTDLVLFRGHSYFAEPPFSAVLLMPFVSLYYSPTFPLQGMLSFVLTVVNFILLYNIAQRITHSRVISLWLSWGYIFSSAYLFIALIPQSWFYNQVVATTLLLLGLFEYLTQKRWWLIGIWVGLALATRENLVLVTVFYIILLLREDSVGRTLKIIQLLTPIFIVGCGVAAYNYLRFGSFTESGFHFLPIPDWLTTNPRFGLWSIRNFPLNFYYLFLKGPKLVTDPTTGHLEYPYITSSEYGLSMLVTSPLFFGIRRSAFKKTLGVTAGIMVLILLSVILSYYVTGYVQYGYRYALDFYPFLFLLLAYSVKQKLPSWLCAVMMGSFLFNLYLISTMFLRIPTIILPLIHSW